MTRLLLLLAVLLLAVPDPATAQHHAHANSAHAAPMGGMHHMMEMHERMMADSLIHRHMMADSSMRAAMHETMGGDMDMDAMHERMAALTPAEREAMKQKMHTQMMERLEAMSPEERLALHERMMEAHRGLMTHPDVKARLMADPELREVMERMHEGGEHDGMKKHGHGMEKQGHGDSGH